MRSVIGRSTGILAAAALCAVSVAWAAPSDAGPSPDAARQLKQLFPGASLHWTGGRLTTIAGKVLATGASPVASAENFIARHGATLGAQVADLIPGSLARDGLAVRELMPLEAGARSINGGAFKFTLVSYLQHKDGVPVYGGDLRLLTRNEAGYPVVLSRSHLFPLENFVVDNAVAANPNVAGAMQAAVARFPGMGNFTAPRVYVFAGTELSKPSPATLAVIFEGAVGQPGDPDYGRWRIVANASTGAIITLENLIHEVDVSGQITGQATAGIAAAECNLEAVAGMPYARATIGATSVFADVNGNFTVPNAGSTAVTVTGSLQGRWFEVRTPSTLEPTISTNVTPPGPANIQFNSANTDQVRRAAVNAYLQANVVRDFTLGASPTYPVIGSQLAFDVNVAVAGTCNAFYDGASINFYNSGGGCNNTAFNDVVHHEYGHHLVDSAGSGQGSYGEGMGDIMGVLISDQPVLGFGFQACASGIRNAANTCQYSAGSCSTCGSEIHACGQLISGAVWSLRNELVATNPSDYRTILAGLAVNSMPLHSGSVIDSSIATDYLVLDDNDADLGNGTPHYCQIFAAFDDHGMPPLSGGELTFSASGGLPSLISPSGAPITLTVGGICSTTPVAGTGKFFVDPEGDGSFVEIPLTQGPTNTYTGNFPATSCGSQIRYYFSAQSSSGTTFTYPSGAPASYHTVIAGSSLSTVFADNFQSATGWTSSVSGATTGQWDRGVPADPFGAGPQSDFDGSGACYVTDNRSGGALGSYDIDAGSVFLVSPTLDASGGEAYVSYARWFDNSGLGGGATPWDDTFLVEVSNNNGSTWSQLELVGPTIESRGGWYKKSFKLSNFLALTSQMKVRFTARDLGTGAVVEAGVDDFSLSIVGCFCQADLNEDGFIDAIDYDIFIPSWLSSNLAADYNGDTFVDAIDYDLFITDWLAGGC